MSSAEEHGTKRGRRSARARRQGGERQTTSSSTATSMRRVDWIRLVVDDDQVRAEAVGVGYRLPATRPIPLKVAEALIAEGTPSVTRRFGSHSADQIVPHGPSGSLDAAR
jgi:hypothetical protein